MLTAIRYRWTIGMAALITVLVASALPARGADGPGPTVSPRLTATGGKCGVRSGNDLVAFSGSATPGSSVQTVLLREFDSSGAQVGADRNITGRNAVQIGADGQISGSTNAGQFNGPGTTSIVAVVTVVKDGVASAPGISDPVIVDRTPPYYIGARTQTTKSVVVSFSEAVADDSGEVAADWKVDGEAALTIEGQGDSRRLGLGLQTLGEDAEPQVQFSFLPTRGGYRDCAGNLLAVDASKGYGLSYRALDRIPPRIPRIVTADDKDAVSAAVSSRNPAPRIVVDTATNGHTIALYRESSETPGFNKSQDTQLGTAVVSGGAAVFDALPPFPADGSYTLYALATDIHGNDSLDSAGSVAADDAIYILDRVAPKALEARATGPNIAVSFTEAVTGTDAPAQWTVTGCTGPCSVQEVSGSGDTRVLKLPSGAFVPTGAQVSWAGGDYVDGAGNPLVPFSLATTQGFPGIVVDLEPEEGTQAVARNYTLRLTVSDALGNSVSGAAVEIRAVSGPTSQRDIGRGPGVLDVCTSQSDGSCTLSYRSNATGRDTLQAWLTGQGGPPPPEPAELQNADGQDVVTVSWVAEGADIYLDANPEASAGSIDDAHVVTVSVKELGSIFDPTPPANIQGINVDLRAMSGPNQGWLGQCDTAGDGTCRITYRSTAVTEAEELLAWIDRSRDNTTAGDLFLNREEPRDADGSPVLDDPSQDVMTRTWLEGTVAPPPPPPPPPPGTGERSVSLTTKSERVRFKNPVRIGGTVLADDGCGVDRVEIERRFPGKGFELLAPAQVDDDGGWTHTFTPARNADYRATIPGDESCAAASSAARFVGVKSKVGARMNRTQITKNRCVKVRGVVRPANPGGRVILQHRRAGKWRRAKLGRLDERSRYAVRACFGKVGRTKLRLRSVKSDSNLVGISPTLVVRVRKR